MEINDENGDLYVGLTHEYSVLDALALEDQSGSIALIGPNSNSIEKLIDLSFYPVDIKLHNNEKLYISTKNIGFLDARILRTDAGLDSIIETLAYRGDGGRIILGEDKLVTVLFSRYSVFDIAENFQFVVEGFWDGFFNQPLLILSEFDALVDREGTGFRLSLLDENESWIIDDGTRYIDFDYYDIRGLSAGRGVADIFRDQGSGQYIARTGTTEAAYINTETLIPHKIINSNDYSSVISHSADDSKFRIALYENKIYLVTSRPDGTTQITIVEESCNNCGQSESPIAAVQPIASNLTIQNAIEFDGSLSVDAEDAGDLVYRWDFNADGEWDTEFVEQSAYAAKYELPGEKRAVLQVMDSSGLVDESEVVFSLDYGINYGEEPVSKNLQDITLLIEDAALDEANNKIYLSSSDTRQFFVINSLTGEVERQFSFRYLPTQMDLSLDGTVLYLGMRGTGCQLMIVDCEDDLFDINDGIIIKFDLAAQAFTDGFVVDVSPADIEVDGDRLYVSANTLYNSWESFKSEISVYDINTYEKIRDLDVGAGSFAEFTNILLIQNESRDSECLNEVGGILEYCDNEIRLLHEIIGYKQNHWLLPGTSIAIDNAGSILDIEAFTNEGSLQPHAPSGLSIGDISVDFDNNVFVVGYNGISSEDGGLIRYFDLSSLGLLAEQPRESWPDWIFYRDNKVVEIARYGNFQYALNIIDSPCFSCE